MNSGSLHNSARAHNRSTKRALLIRNANAFDFGGAERFTVALATELSSQGWECALVTAHQALLAHAAAAHVKTIPGKWWDRQDWSGKKALLAPIYFFWQLRLTLWYVKLFRQWKPSVVHPQGKDDFIAATIAARILGIRVIWTDHADLKYIFRNVRTLYKNPVGKLVHFCSRWAAAITLVSKSEANLVSQALGRPLPLQYHVVYNGVRDQQPKPVQRNSADKNACIFCTTVRLVTAKGVGELITAFLGLDDDRHLNVRLWIVGDGPEADRFKEMAKGNPRITFWGFHDNVLPIVAASDVFIHPSYHEGFSISLVEAAMLSKPIIACNVGGNPEIITDEVSGLLVPAKNATELSDAMRRLATDTHLAQQLARAARKIYQANFQFDVIVKESFIPFYEG